jgi:hypothetical protein
MGTRLLFQVTSKDLLHFQELSLFVRLCPLRRSPVTSLSLASRQSCTSTWWNKNHVVACKACPEVSVPPTTFFTAAVSRLTTRFVLPKIAQAFSNPNRCYTSSNSYLHARLRQITHQLSVFPPPQEQRSYMHMHIHHPPPSRAIS